MKLFAAVMGRALVLGPLCALATLAGVLVLGWHARLQGLLVGAAWGVLFALVAAPETWAREKARPVLGAVLVALVALAASFLGALQGAYLVGIANDGAFVAANEGITSTIELLSDSPNLVIGLAVMATPFAVATMKSRLLACLSSGVAALGLFVGYVLLHTEVFRQSPPPNELGGPFVGLALVLPWAYALGEKLSSKILERVEGRSSHESR